MAQLPGTVEQPEGTVSGVPRGLVTPALTPKDSPSKNQGWTTANTIEVSSSFAGPVTGLGISTRVNPVGPLNIESAQRASGIETLLTPPLINEEISSSKKRNREEYTIGENVATVTHDSDCPLARLPTTSRHKSICRCIGQALSYEPVNIIESDDRIFNPTFTREDTEESLPDADLDGSYQKSGSTSALALPTPEVRTFKLPDPPMLRYTPSSWFNGIEIQPQVPELDAIRVPTDPKNIPSDRKSAEVVARFRHLETRMVADIDAWLRDRGEKADDWNCINDLNRLPTYAANTQWLDLKGTKKLTAVAQLGQIMSRTWKALEFRIQTAADEAERLRTSDNPWRADYLGDLSDFPIKRMEDAFAKLEHDWQLEFCALLVNPLLMPMNAYWGVLIQYYFGKTMEEIASMLTQKSEKPREKKKRKTREKSKKDRLG